MATHTLCPVDEPGAQGSSARSLANLADVAARCTPDSCGATATVTTGEAAADPPAAVTHPDLSALVSVQWETGEGPIRAALDTGRPVSSEDLLHDDRWPAYRTEALEAGVRSSTTLPYLRDGMAITVTVYGFRPGITAESGECAAAALGDLAATGLARDRHYRRALAEVGRLDAALRSRPVVDQACGIMMYVLGCDADDAFTMLRKLSQRTNRKLHDLAAGVVRTRGRGLERELRVMREETAGR
ncbi:transcriptional regulator [Streptomyces sp. Ru73]|uniref:ANTAR domain-containing response regulator n=1 Tax=Streptomyces sp. Ru73 TaxID=2080748 RepID=UPI000CDD4319|nr:ANTAR domain-containing protein [Streptomyces sp. Ru73]POX40208.1 transcriptional regulator [Streptomyces sp. Ru73]